MYVRSHDFTTDYSWISMTGFDLVWCCEVAEHIDEFYSQYFVETLVLNTNKVLALTAAPPGADGYHHVNCRPAKYWIDRVEAAGLTFRPDLTDAAKQLCGPDYGRSRNNYFRRNGMIFTR